MSKLMKNLLTQKAAHSKKLQTKLEGESQLYMGDPSLHWGVGGWVRGKANLTFGPKGCLDGDTWINCRVKDPKNNIFNIDGYIKDLYRNFQEVGNDYTFETLSVDSNGILMYNKIVNVVETGTQECFLLKTQSGKEITATGDHKFLTDNDFKPLSDLQIGDTVFIQNMYNKQNTITDTITSIVSVGSSQTYDIMCQSPMNNFLANDIVVHNSGKSSLCLIAAGAEQKKTNGWVVIFDSEYAHSDPNEMLPDSDELTQTALDARVRYAQAGINYEKLLVISSNEINTLFGSLGDIEKEIKNGDLNVSAMIVDSWAGIQGESAKGKIEAGEVAAAGNSYGGNAKVMGPVLQTLLRISAENGITSFFVQHCIQNMEQYGPRWILLGGEKLKFLVHSVTFVESIAAKDAGLMEGDQTSDKNEGVRVGKRIRFRCEKSRRVVEGRTGEFYMNFKELRFARPEESLFNLAKNLGVIGHPRTYLFEDDGITPKIDKKTGNPMFKENNVWWCFPANAASPIKFQGEAKCIEALRTDKDLYQQVWEMCEKTDSMSGLSAGDSISTVESV